MFYGLSSAVAERVPNAELSKSSKNTYTLTTLPPGRKAIASKWVFKQKMDTDGNIIRYKACLVAKGFSQVPSIDHDLTHAPTLRLESFRLFLALAASLDLELHGMDVVGAYLNDDLDREIYMTHPPGFSDGTKKVLRLLKTIYRLKQSGRAWQQTLEAALIKLGYQPLTSHQSLFICRTGTHADLLAIHVNDIALASHSSRIAQCEKELTDTFEMNILGELTSMIGFTISRDRSACTIRLSQAHYARKIVERMGLATAHPSPTPLDTHAKLVQLPNGQRDPKTVNAPYHFAIGSLMYLAMGTQYDLAFTVQHLSQFASNLSAAH